jgi:hypothetical protein
MHAAFFDNIIRADVLSKKNDNAGHVCAIDVKVTIIRSLRHFNIAWRMLVVLVKTSQSFIGILNACSRIPLKLTKKPQSDRRLHDLITDSVIIFGLCFSHFI